MEFENLSCFDAVRLSLRTALGKEPKLRRLPKHVQKEMKCQRIRSNARRWKTGRVYSETVEIDSAKEGYGEKDVFSGDVPYPQVSVETHHLLGEVNNDNISYHIDLFITLGSEESIKLLEYLPS